MTINIRKPYDAHERSLLTFPHPSLTKQAMGKDTDINNIMAKYRKTGLLDHLNQHHGIYGDFMDVTDYHTAQNAMIEANNAFSSLPADLRKKFDNDAGKFLDFVHDEANTDEMVEMGLAHRSEGPGGDTGIRETPPPTEPVEPAPEAAPAA